MNRKQQEHMRQVMIKTAEIKRLADAESWREAVAVCMEVLMHQRDVISIYERKEKKS